MANRTSDEEVIFSFAFHGGAGVIPRGSINTQAYYESLAKVLRKTYEYAETHLHDNAVSAVDVAQFGVEQLENDPYYNAGHGAVFTADETHEMEASIMDGRNKSCGAVSLIRTIKNPIAAARVVMEKTAHNYLVGEAAEQLGIAHGLPYATIEEGGNAFFDTEKRKLQLRKAQQTSGFFNDHDLLSFSTATAIDSVTGSVKSMNISNKASIRVDPLSVSVGEEAEQMEVEEETATGTVGCVCYYKGSTAAATSTGGMTNKLSGRIGDTPLIGVGNYASNDTCAVSCTGKGEVFMESVAAYDIAARMRYGGMDLRQAVASALHLHTSSSTSLPRPTATPTPAIATTVASTVATTTTTTTTSTSVPLPTTPDEEATAFPTSTGTTAPSLPEGAGGVVAVEGASGQVVLDFNSPGMMRGWASKTILNTRRIHNNSNNSNNSSNNSNFSSSGSSRDGDSCGDGGTGINCDSKKRDNTKSSSAQVVFARGQVGLWEEYIDVAPLQPSPPPVEYFSTISNAGDISTSSSSSSSSSSMSVADMAKGMPLQLVMRRFSTVCEASENTTTIIDSESSKSTPSFVFNPSADLKAIGELRYQVWQEENAINPSLFPDKRWVDDLDHNAEHWLLEIDKDSFDQYLLRSQSVGGVGSRGGEVKVSAGTTSTASNQASPPAPVAQLVSETLEASLPVSSTGCYLLASARLTVHKSFEDSYRDVQLWRRGGHPLPLPTTDLGRLVVHQSVRGLGIAQLLNQQRISAAQQLGAKSIMVTASAGNKTLLQKVGFVDIGERITFDDRPGALFYALQYNF